MGSQPSRTSLGWCRLPGTQPRLGHVQWGNEQPGHVKREKSIVLFDCARRAKRSPIIAWPCGLKDLGRIGTPQGGERGSGDGRRQPVACGCGRRALKHRQAPGSERAFVARAGAVGAGFRLQPLLCVVREPRFDLAVTGESVSVGLPVLFVLLAPAAEQV